MPDKNIAERIAASALGGAVGDMYGAPYEMSIKPERLAQTRASENADGLAPYLTKTKTGKDMDQRGIGAVTDDTTMLACVAFGMMAAPPTTPVPALTPSATEYHVHQAFLRWGDLQDGTDMQMGRFINHDVKLPSPLSHFLFCCGAGSGTIASLNTGKIGTLADPLNIGTMDAPSYNDGCGGMMRAAPAGWLPRTFDHYAWGCGQAAITHGDPVAVHASGFIAALVGQAVQGRPLGDAFNDAAARVQNTQVSQLIQSALAVPGRDIDALPVKLGIAQDGARKGFFKAAGVLVQVVGVLKAFGQDGGMGPDAFKAAMQLAARQRGDSDSVCAIVGNILGAAHGRSILPEKWVSALQSGRAIEQMAADYTKTFYPAAPAPGPALRV